MTERSARALTGALLLAVATTGCTTAPRVPPVAMIEADRDLVIDDRELVVLTEGDTARRELALRSRQFGYETLNEQRLDGIDLHLFLLRIPVGLSGASAIAQIERIAPGITAGVNHAYELQRPPVQAKGGREDWAFDGVQWQYGACRALGPVGLIDSAVDARLADQLGFDLTTRNFVSDTETAPGAHGTALAYILSGNGRLGDLHIRNAVVVEEAGETAAGVDRLALAVDWLVSEGVTVANVSLAGPYNKILDKTVARASRRGLLIVAAVGNDGPAAPPRFPAAFEEVVAVTAIDADGALYERAVRGPHVDVAAPGVDVPVDVDHERRFVSGTSIAAPLASALLAATPDADLGSLSDLTRETDGRDTFGRGIVDFSRGCGANDGSPG